MGQQQILLIVLSVILVGIAIAVGITMFTSQAEQSDLDSVIAELNNIGAQAYQFYIRPASMGGGGNTFTGVKAYLDALPMLVNSTVADFVVTQPANTTDPVLIDATSQANTSNARRLTVTTAGVMTLGPIPE